MIEEAIEPVQLTLKELVDHYEGFLKECERKSPETRGTYQRALRDFIKWLPVDKKFRFRVRDVERYKRYLVERKQLQNVSVATYMTALRRLCQHLIDVGVLANNPAKRVVGGRRPSKHSRTFLTSTELQTPKRSSPTAPCRIIRSITTTKTNSTASWRPESSGNRPLRPIPIIGIR